MTTEERVKLRDKLTKELIHSGHLKTFNGRYAVRRMTEFNRLLKSDSDLKKDCVLYIQQFKSCKEALYCITHGDDVSNHACLVCGGVCGFSKSNKRYNSTCGSTACIGKLANSEEAREKGRQTSRLKFGVDNPAQSDAVKEKMKQTNLTRHGVEYASQSAKFKTSVKRTNLERRGVECSFQSEETKAKIRATNLERRGVECAMQCPEVLEKAKKTNLRNLGVENPFQSEKIKAKIRQTNLQNLGVENPMQSEEVRHRAEETMLSNLGVRHALQSEKIKQKVKTTKLERYDDASYNNREKAKQTNLKLFGYEYATQSDAIKDKIKQTNLKIHGVKYGFQTLPVNPAQSHIRNYDIWPDDKKLKDFIARKYEENKTLLALKDVSGFFGVGDQTVKRKLEPLDLLKYFYIQDSNLKLQFEEFLNLNNILHHRHNRAIIYPREIDFTLDSVNIGFEINDIASHNSIGNGCYGRKDAYYHLNKTIDSKKNGFRLVHIWEWEMRNEDEWGRLSLWILNLVNNNKDKVGARKCAINKVDVDEEKRFLNSYHLQGYRKSSVCYGLYYNNELVQLMSFCKPRFNKNYEWELLRLCTRYGRTVTGGANKLLKCFIEAYNPSSIISYCDLDKFAGDVYENLEFKTLRSFVPQIVWCNKNMRHFSQSSLNMIGADSLLGTSYGKGACNEEIAIECGYIPIYNCGTAVYGIQFK